MIQLFIIETVYREVSIDRNTAAETQTLKQGREGRKPDREPKENEGNGYQLCMPLHTPRAVQVDYH